jgi:hypothetical protein
MDKKVALFRSLGRLLDSGGRLVSLVSAPEIYVNEMGIVFNAGLPGESRCKERRQGAHRHARR